MHSARRPQPIRLSSRWVFFADVKRLLYFSDNVARFVFDLNREHRLQLLLALERPPCLVELFLCDAKLRRHLPAPWLAEPYACRLVPHDVLPPQVLDQHQHVERVRHRIKRTSVMRPNIIRIPEAQVHLYIDLPAVRADAAYLDPRSHQRRIETDECMDVALDELLHQSLKFFPTRFSIFSRCFPNFCIGSIRTKTPLLRASTWPSWLRISATVQ